MSLDRLQLLVNELNSSNSTKDKINILKSYSDCKQYLSYTYDTIRFQYGVTSDNIISKEQQFRSSAETSNDVGDGSLFSLLNNLSNRTLTGNNAIIAVLHFIYKNSQHKKLILNIIDRNLETRVGISIINKVFPGCISEFSVALANSLSDYDPNRTKIDFSNNRYFVERKLDGVRTIALIDSQGNITFKSRNGKEYNTLGVIKEQLQKLNLTNCVIDGECCLLNSDGTDDFQGMMKEIRRKNHTIENAAFRCFDIVKLDEFYQKHSTKLYSERYESLKYYLDSKQLPNIGIVDAIEVNSWDDVDNYQHHAIENNWEGIMLRKDTFYKGDRSNDLLKIKEFNEREFVVKNVEIGPFRVINYDANGRSYEATENIVTTIFVEYEGNIVGVGSGMSIDMRRLWSQQPSLIIGKTITVKYFEETVDKNGNKSLRFPTLKIIHGIERNT